MLKKLGQRGDTILEVLISVAVLSLVLSTTFALANKNSQANRQAGERGEASKIAQAEVEKLKLFIEGAGVTLPAENSYFCVDLPATGPQIVVIGGSGAPLGLASSTLATDPFYGASNPCKGGSGNMYYRYIYRGTVADGTQNTFTAVTRWPAVTGNGVDQVTMVHKIFPDTASAILALANTSILPLASASLTAASTTITVGRTTTLDLRTTSVSSCTPSTSPPWNPSNALSGTFTIGPLAPGMYTYRINCTGIISGSPSATATVTVTNPPAFRIFRDGSAFTSCSNAEPRFNDGADGCFTAGQAVYGRRNISINYSFPPSQPDGPAQIRIFYQQFAGALILPPPSYSYNINYQLGSDSMRSTALPIEATPASWGGRWSEALPVNIVGGSTSLNITWTNNSGDGGDSDLLIWRVELYRL